MSIQQAYAVILKDTDALNCYRTYRNLKLGGYKLEKYEKPLKRDLDEKTESTNKKLCLEAFAGSSKNDSVSRIVEDAPSQIQNVETVNWDYKVRFPESTKKDEKAFYLYMKYVSIKLFNMLFKLFLF